jgi:cytochrome c peroxidase
MNTRSLLTGAVALLVLVALLTLIALLWPRPTWNSDEIATLNRLWIGNLPPAPPDPSNHVADDPRAAVLGHKLFFDTRFSANGAVACATCHLPERGFQDDRPLGVGVGVANRRTMPLTGAAYSPWFFWDGRKDSQWAQALGPLENAVEHGGNRSQYAHLIAEHYRSEYEAIFGPLPDLSTLPASAGPVEDATAKAAWEAMTPEQQDAVSSVFANMGKAIAAYERLLMPGAARFDGYVAALLTDGEQAAQDILTADEVAGLKLFIGDAHCIDCHNGPLFTNNDFHNTGIPAAPDLPEDMGRATGVQQLLADEFNCLGPYSDANPEECDELRFVVTDYFSQIRRYKPPSLRNVADRPPYMHAGQIATLDEVLRHYNAAPAAPAGHSELNPLDLSEPQLDQLEAFLRTLSAPLDVAPQWLAPPER